ncbi:MAG: RNA-binding cell elongation regulator Jag/EloR [Lachnospiraceae bacterium]
MSEITVSARTLDDAITEASVELGITSDQLDYDIIEKGSTGFLGIGMKQAVIKARKKSLNIPTPKVESKTTVHKKVEVLKTEVPNKDLKEELKEEPKEESKEEIKMTTKREADLVEVTVETKEVCENFLKDVLKTIGMEVKVTSTIDEEGALSMEMVGDNMGILIGKRGQTLDSLQYLTNRVANKMQEGYVRVKLDTENYRQRRKETLENLGKNIAHKVKRTRKSVSLEPMNPYERRIIHSALQGDHAISTHSEGDEPYRRVVITLEKNK